MMHVLDTIASLQGDDGRVVLGREETTKIDHAARQILSRLGFRVEHPTYQQKLKASGYHVDGSVIRVEEARLDKLLGLVPRQDEGRHTGQGQVNVGYLCNQIYDADLDAIRSPSRQDLDRATVVALSLPEVGRVRPLFEPKDIPGSEDVLMLDVMLRRTKRSDWYGEILKRPSIPIMLDMCSVVAGSREEALKRGMLIYHAFITSPLKYDNQTLDFALAALAAGLPVRFGSPMSISGVSAPITFAGTLAMALAEAYTGLVLSELFGQPWEPAMSPICLDPQTGMSQYSGPDRVLLSLATCDILRHLGLGGGIGHNTKTDASKPGLLAGIEKAYSAMLNLLAGQPPDITAGGQLGPGGLVACIEQIVIDCEIVSMLNRLVRGIEVNDETLALDLIFEMGFDGRYMEQEHTAAHFRSEQWLPTIVRRLGTSAWNAEKPDMLEAARKRVKDILATNDPRALDPKQEAELDRIVGTHSLPAARQ